MISVTTHIEKNLVLGDVSKFVPIATKVENGGTCRASKPSPIGATDRVVSMAFLEGALAVRIVAVTLDTLDRVVYYSDTFGDLRGRLDPDTRQMVAMGARSSIHVDAAHGMGTLENVDPESRKMITVRADDVWDAPSLGTPRTMMEHVVRVCGAN